MSNIYTDFASLYDLFMDNVPYEEWADYISKKLCEYKITDGIVADLGCGSGVLTRLLANKGYDMIGIDSSVEMLQIAREDDSEDILYLCQDIREFELYGTVSAIVSTCDSLNYITASNELLETFRLINNYLERDGLFIFDLNTPFKYQEILADNTFAESREKAAFIWDNYFDEDEKINEYCLTMFYEAEDGRYDRADELHYERSYSLEEIKTLLNEAGLEFIAAFSDYTDETYKDGMEVERMLIIAKEGYQEGKTYI